MSRGSAIEWTDDTWNPVTGCDKVSAGCANCYAETFANRFKGVPGHHFEKGFEVVLRPERLDQPLHWKEPRRIFVNSMSDLFHEQVPFEFALAVLARCATATQHTYQILTKRPARALEFFNWMRTYGGYQVEMRSHIWLGVSVENQKAADERIPLLLQAPVSTRFISAEPLLGPLDLTGPLGLSGYRADGASPYTGAEAGSGLNWVIVGGESGHGARPMHPEWARAIRDQCQKAGVPFFFKQWGQFKPVEPQLILDGQVVGAITQFKSSAVGMTEAMAPTFQRVGKKAAGRVLDGRTWDEFPS